MNAPADMVVLAGDIARGGVYENPVFDPNFIVDLDEAGMKSLQPASNGV